MSQLAKITTLLVIGILGLAFLTGPASAEQLGDKLVERAATLRDRALNDPLAYELVASLTTEVGPRLAGSAGDIAAVHWAQNRLQSLGFSNVRIEPVTVPHWERGELHVGIASPFKQKLVGTMLGGSVGTAQAGLRAPVLRVENMDELAALDDAQVAGHIVFVDQRMRRAKDGGGYREAVGKRVTGASISAAKGALAHVIRSVGTDDHRTGHTGTLVYAEDAPRIPALALSAPDADMLARQIGGGKPVHLSIKSTARRLDDATSYNVIGEIVGSSRKDEIVLLGAHLDSWDEGTGAIDDGAGVAIVTAAAKLVGDLRGKPKRTLRVVLFANEEFGLSGAKAYREKYDAQIINHVIGMEADMGAGAVWRFESNVAPEALGLITQIHALLEPLGIELGENKAFGGADIGPLLKAGMPVYGFRQDATDYFDYHHTPGDTLDKIDPAQLRQNVAAYAVAAFIAANIDEDFWRVPVPE